MKNIIEIARKHVFEICKDPNKFKMSIPARDDDSDSIICAALDYADELKDENSVAIELINALQSIPGVSNAIEEVREKLKKR